MGDTDRLYRMPEVCDRIGLGRSSIYAYVADGIFPPPVRIGARAVAWRASDIAAFIDSRAVGIGIVPRTVRA